MIKRARRMEPVRGFGIDRVAAAAETISPGERTVLRLENLDTNLPLPPEALPATVSGLATPQAIAGSRSRETSTCAPPSPTSPPPAAATATTPNARS
jgi:hypothetical protein